MMRTLARLEPPATAPQPLRGPHRLTLALLLLLSAQVASQTLINANFSMAVSDLASSTPTATVDGVFESDAAVDRDAEMLMSDAVFDRDAERKAKARAHRRSVPADSLGSATPRRTAGSPSCPPTLPNDPRLTSVCPLPPSWLAACASRRVYAANGSPKLRLLSERDVLICGRRAGDCGWEGCDESCPSNKYEVDSEKCGFAWAWTKRKCCGSAPDRSALHVCATSESSSC